MSTSCRSPIDSSRASRLRRCSMPTRLDGAIDGRPIGRAAAQSERFSWGMRPSATTSSTRIENGSSTWPGTTATSRASVERSDSATGTPSSTDEPAGRAHDPVRQRRRLDLPAPLGPTRQTRSPAPTRRSMPRSTSRRGRPAGCPSPRPRCLCGSQLVPRPGSAQEDQEERRADDRGHDAHRQLARDARDEVGERSGKRPRTAPTAAGRGGRSARPAGARRGARRARRSRSARQRHGRGRDQRRPARAGSRARDARPCPGGRRSPRPAAGH